MKKRYLVLISMLVVLGLICLAGAQTRPAAPKKATFISFGGGPAGGIFSTLVSAISTVTAANIKDIVHITVVGTGGGGENIVRVDKGELELGVTDGMSLHQAYHGIDGFKGAPKSNLRALGIMVDGLLHVVTLEKSDIRAVGDFAGKNIAIGTPGSSTALLTDVVFTELGLKDKYKATYTLGRTAATSLKDGHIDAFTWVSPAPTGVMVELASGTKIRMIDLVTPLRKTGFIKKHPYCWEGVIKAGTYGLTADLPALYTGLYWVANKNVDEEVIYQLTKNAYENTKALADIYGPMRVMTLEHALYGLTIPLHPGAARYFTERGVKIPEALRDK